MADTTTSITTNNRDGKRISVPLAAATKALQGTIACRNAAGYAVPGSDTANLVVLGIFAEEVDNSTGAAGDLSVVIERKAAFLLLNDPVNPVTIASVGTAGAAVIKDNQTVCVAAGAANDIPVGKPIEIVPAGVWVEIA
ncbi:MAG: hypothetical protein OJI67_07845 [Prosthecobacter sp.]|nr:hypothetical protein [Prosthecobacter sp.]